MYDPGNLGYADFNYDDYKNINEGITGGVPRQFHHKPDYMGYQVDGNKVWSSGDNLAWRCVKGVNGRIVKILASGGKYPAVGLAIIAASVKRI